MDANAEIRRLRERVEHLEFCLEEVTKPAPAEATEYGIDKLRLPRLARRALGILLNAKGRAVSHGAIVAGIYWDRPEAPPDLAEGSKLTHVLVCHIRKELRDSGSPLRVQTVWGLGYRAEIPAG